MLINWLEEVGMYEREHYHADAFDADDDMFVFLDTDDVASVAFEVTTGYTYGLVLLEIRFSEYFTLCCVFSCE